MTDSTNETLAALDVLSRKQRIAVLREAHDTIERARALFGADDDDDLAATQTRDSLSFCAQTISLDITMLSTPPEPRRPRPEPQPITQDMLDRWINQLMDGRA